MRLLLAAMLSWPIVGGVAARADDLPPAMARHDRDGDGRLSAREFPGPDAAFARIDRDGDGLLTASELRIGAPGAPTAAPRPAPPAPGGPRVYVDTHLHLHPRGLGATLGKRAGAADGGPVDPAAALARAADNLVGRMDRMGVEAGLIVVVPERAGAGEETYARTRAAVARHPGRLYLMAGGATLNPALQATSASAVTDAVRRTFRARAEQVLAEGAKSFGEMLSYHLCMTEGHSFQIAPADHPLYLLLADIAAERGVPIDLHMEAVERATEMPANLRRACAANPARLEPTVPALERLLAHNRGARIVWQHIGWDNTGQMTPALLERLLAAHPNLYLALRVEARPEQVGGGGPMANRIVDPAFRVRPEWLAFMEAHADRLVIGSDDFIGPAEEGYRGSQSFDETWSMVRGLPPALSERIGRDNAREIYGLGR